MNKQLCQQKHDCKSIRIGDWIIYSCPECRYILRENWRTREWIIEQVGNVNVKHLGEYFPQEYRETFENVN